jgi:hypothetical protein
VPKTGNPGYTSSIFRLIAGLCWIIVAILNFDRLGFPAHLRDYRGFHSNAVKVLLPCTTSLFFLIAAALGFRDAHRASQEAPDLARTNIRHPQ